MVRFSRKVQGQRKAGNVQLFHRPLWAFVILLLTCGSHASAPRYTGGKVSTAPAVDGTFSEGEWAGGVSVDGSFFGDGAPATEYPIHTKLAYDEKYIYFLAVMGDPEPTSIRAREYRRSVGVGLDDNVKFEISTNGVVAQRHAFTFNPSTANFIVLPGGSANKVEWSGEVDSQGKITATGWQVEARIPWNILRLPSKTGPVDMRFFVTRYVARTNQQIFQQFLLPADIEDMGVWEQVMVPAIKRYKTLKILPYTYGGVVEDGKPIQNSGFDLKTSIGANLDLIATVNPDFRNIEDSILDLGFSYFERLAGESRPFFLEGSEYFNRAGSIFRTQRVRDIDFGAKAIGQMNKRLRIGAMALQDVGKESSSVVSASANPDDKSTVNVGLAHLDRDNLQSLAGFFSANRQYGKTTAAVRWSGHRDNIIGTGHDFAASLEYADRGWGAYFGAGRREKKFRPRLGFTNDTDFQGANGSIYLTDRRVKSGSIASWGGSMGFSSFSRITGQSYNRDANINGYLRFRNGLSTQFGAGFARFLGRDDQTTSITTEYPYYDNRKNVYYSHTWGNISGKRYLSQSTGITYQFSPRILTALSAEFVDHFQKQSQWIGVGTLDLGADQTLSTRFVRRQNDYNIYFSYRKSGGRGAEYYVILGDPNAQSFRTSLVLKAVFPIEIRY
jgi:hypothetical protein